MNKNIMPRSPSLRGAVNSAVVYHFSIALCIFLCGCCGLRNSQNTHTIKDTAIVIIPPSISVDTTIDNYTPTASAICDTIAILEMYGSFNIVGTDTSGMYIAVWNAVKRELNMAYTPKPIVKYIRTEDIYTSTIVKRPKLIEILGYAFCGLLLGFGIYLIIKFGIVRL